MKASLLGLLKPEIFLGLGIAAGTIAVILTGSANPGEHEMRAAGSVLGTVAAGFIVGAAILTRR